MGLLRKEVFICVDCETTGLDTEKDVIIEVGAVRFTFDEILDRYESLVNPGIPIPEEARAIHNISDEMVAEAPSIDDVLPNILTFIETGTLIGHNIMFDLKMLARAANKPALLQRRHIDTLRLARLYGEAPKNSLEALRDHFGIPPESAHRALDDAYINSEVFKKLAHRYKTVEQILEALSRPIRMKHMPLGKHKGRPFREIPLSYLRWASHQKFDDDLLYSIRHELKRRKSGSTFGQSSNPFQEL